MSRSPDLFLPPGTLVRYDGLEDGPEYGRVVHCWYDAATEGMDCYVAFFGPEMPTGAPHSKPYILRYGVGSLLVMPEGA